jgi:hypothetical protein
MVVGVGNTPSTTGPAATSPSNVSVDQITTSQLRLVNEKGEVVGELKGDVTGASFTMTSPDKTGHIAMWAATDKGEILAVKNEVKDGKIQRSGAARMFGAIQPKKQGLQVTRTTGSNTFVRWSSDESEVIP